MRGREGKGGCGTYIHGKVRTWEGILLQLSISILAILGNECHLLLEITEIRKLKKRCWA